MHGVTLLPAEPQRLGLQILLMPGRLSSLLQVPALSGPVIPSTFVLTTGNLPTASVFLHFYFISILTTLQLMNIYYLSISLTFHQRNFLINKASGNWGVDPGCHVNQCDIGHEPRALLSLLWSLSCQW